MTPLRRRHFSAALAGGLVLPALGWPAAVLFLGRQGQALAERLVGVAVPDFYGAYLDERLATARQALAAHKRA